MSVSFSATLTTPTLILMQSLITIPPYSFQKVSKNSDLNSVFPQRPSPFSRIDDSESGNFRICSPHLFTLQKNACGDILNQNCFELFGSPKNGDGSEKGS